MYSKFQESVVRVGVPDGVGSWDIVVFSNGLGIPDGVGWWDRVVVLDGIGLAAWVGVSGELGVLLE